MPPSVSFITTLDNARGLLRVTRLAGGEFRVVLVARLAGGGEGAD